MQMMQEHEVCMTQTGAKNAELSECAWEAAALPQGQCKSEGTGLPSVYWARFFLQEPWLL